MADMASMPMEGAGAMPPDAEGGADTMADMSAPDDTGDLSQGYCIEISVLPDGTYQVSPPESLKEEAAEEQGGEPGSEAGQTFDSVGAALKQVLKLMKDNPVGGDGQASFEAGYGQG